MNTAPCALCGANADRNPMPSFGRGAYGTPLYHCPECGRYVLGEVLAMDWEGSKSDRAFKIACLVREKQLASKRVLYGILEDEFQPTDKTIDRHLQRWWRISDLLAEFPKPTEVIDRALLNLSRLVDYPFQAINRSWKECEYLLYSRGQSAHAMVRFMEDMGLLGETGGSDELLVRITPAGWERIDTLSRTIVDSRQAFVAMWFTGEMDRWYQNAIKPGIEAAGFEPKRIDLVEHNKKICDEIIAEIRRSRFVVADFTGQRGGVYFEAGYAMALGLPVIFLVPKADVDALHFDTRQYNHIVYDTEEDLKHKLQNRIAATIL